MICHSTIFILRKILRRRYMHCSWLVCFVTCTSSVAYVFYVSSHAVLENSLRYDRDTAIRDCAAIGRSTPVFPTFLNRAKIKDMWLHPPPPAKYGEAQWAFG